MRPSLPALASFFRGLCVHLARKVSGDLRYIHELELQLSLARDTIGALSIVTNGPEQDGYFEADGATFYRSAFNAAWLEEFSVKPQTIVDVGSYDAGDAVRFKLLYPHARVIAFEADPDRATLFKLNAERFGVEAIEAAAFSSDGTIPWFQATAESNGKKFISSQGSAYRHNDAMNARFPHVHQHDTPITVRAHRLDTYCKASGITCIDLLHVDAQGSEHDVINGLGALRPPLIYLELDDGEAGWVKAKGRGEIHALMRDLGYVAGADIGTDRLYVLRSTAGACLSK